MNRLLYTVVTILTILIASNIWSGEPSYQGRLRFADEQKEFVRLGEIFRAKLELWPGFNFKSNDGKDLESTLLFGLFNVVKTFGTNLDENNQDVFVVDLLLVAAKPYKNLELHLLDFAGQSFVCSLDKIGKVRDVAIEIPKEPIVVSIDWNQDSYWYIWPLFVLLICMVVGLKYYTYLKKKKVALKLQNEIIDQQRQKKEFWKGFLLSASSRGDFEKLYLCKNEWVALITVDNDAVAGFLETIDRYQYLREWDQTKLDQISTFLERLNNGI